MIIYLKIHFLSVGFAQYTGKINFFSVIASEPVSAQVLFETETVAVGMIVAVLVFPLQSFLCFLLRKTQSQVTRNNLHHLVCAEIIKKKF